MHRYPGTSFIKRTGSVRGNVCTLVIQPGKKTSRFVSLTILTLDSVGLIHETDLCVNWEQTEIYTCCTHENVCSSQLLRRYKHNLTTCTVHFFNSLYLHCISSQSHLKAAYAESIRVYEVNYNQISPNCTPIQPNSL